MYRLAQVKRGEKTEWYYFLEPAEGERSRLVLYLCEGCQSESRAEAYIQKLGCDARLVKNISAGMYEEKSASYEKRRQFGKSVYKATLDQKKFFLREINNDFGERAIQEISEREVETLLLSKQKSGSWKNSYLETLMDIYREAKWNGIKVALPGFQRFKRNSKKADVLTEDEIKALFEPRNFSNQDLLLMFELGLCCGLRLGEMRAARKRQIIAGSRALVVDGYINKMGERTNYNKKGSREKPKFRVAFLTQSLMERLLERAAQRGLADDDFLFSTDGRPFTQTYAYKNFLRAVKMSGIPTEGRKISPHSLRYTYITKMRGQLSGETVRKLAGHSSIEMTDYYTRASLNDLIEELGPTQKSVELCFGLGREDTKLLQT